MVRTIASIFIAFALIAGLSWYETTHVQRVFSTFEQHLTVLYKKTESETANYEDGEVVRRFWNERKKTLHILIPHTSIETVDYQLNEAMGYLYEEKYEDAIPKIEVLIEISKKIPRAYSLRLENIF